MYFRKQLKAVTLAVKQGGVTSRQLLDIYPSRRSTYRVLNDLERSGLLNKTEAPESEPASYVWTPTDRLKELMNIKK